MTPAMQLVTFVASWGSYRPGVSAWFHRTQVEELARLGVIHVDRQPVIEAAVPSGPVEHAVTRRGRQKRNG